MTDKNTDDLVVPETIFVRARTAYPSLADRLDAGEWAIAGAKALAANWRKDILVPLVGEALDLRHRVALLAVTVTERGLDLGEALADQIEQDRLIAAGTLARALIEVVGLAKIAAQDLPALAPPGQLPDAGGLAQLTAKLLLGSGLKSQPPPFQPKELIAAGKKAIGDHFGSDYGYLSNFTHPNGTLVWAAELHDGHVVTTRPSVSVANAETLAKVLAAGLAAIQVDCSDLIEWAPLNVDLAN